MVCGRAGLIWTARAGRAGGFGHIVDRVGQAEELRAHGADVVVSDLAELLDS
jgi:phosphoglycolate phosphatase-like HAD superfamily hydrolase